MKKEKNLNKDFKREYLPFSLRLDKYFFKVLMMSIAVIMVWRGVWNLLDMYLLPNQFVLSNLISILIGLGLLYLPDSDNLDRL